MWELVMCGEVWECEKVVEWVENLWNGIEEWREGEGYIVDV